MARLLVVLAAAALCAAARGSEEGVVSIADGTLTGVLKTSSRSFLGVPFAAPPVGELRWARPQPIAAPYGNRSATSYSKACMQVGGEEEEKKGPSLSYVS